MKITNVHNLPQAFVNMANIQREIVDKQYSVTEILKSVREIILTRRHYDEIEEDAADMIWLLFGTAVHKVLEQHATGETEFAEERLYQKMPNGYTLTGQIDLYDMHEGITEDWKTATAWKVIFGDFEDWEKQARYYAYLLWKHGLPLHLSRFWAILKDHSKSEAARKSDYPKIPVFKKQFPLNKDTDLKPIEDEILDKFFQIEKANKLSDADLPLCSPEERWNSGNKYAVIKNGRKTALRVLGSREEAEHWAANNGGDYIEERLGVDRKCAEYCSCCEFCDYWQKYYKNKTEATE